VRDDEADTNKPVANLVLQTSICVEQDQSSSGSRENSIDGVHYVRQRTEHVVLCEQTEMVRSRLFERVEHPSTVYWSFKMIIRTTLVAAAVAATVLTTTTGCAVSRGQETTGAYIDDSTITATVKSRFVESKAVDAASISVETMKGTVMLSGFAKSANEKSSAESIARGVSGVKSVKNEIAVRP
jgi:osmotically-inducible protein OsmY